MIDLVSIESTLPIDKERLAPRSDNLIPRLMAAFGTLVAVAVAYFQMRMQLSRLDALYFVACGLGRLGSFVAEGLLVRGEHVLVVARNEDAPAVAHLRVLGADVYIGHARLPRVLHDVSVTRAKALYSLTNDDYANLEIELNARSFDPDLRLVLRIFTSRCQGASRDTWTSTSRSA